MTHYQSILTRLGTVVPNKSWSLSLSLPSKHTSRTTYADSARKEGVERVLPPCMCKMPCGCAMHARSTHESPRARKHAAHTAPKAGYRDSSLSLSAGRGGEPWLERGGEGVFFWTRRLWNRFQTHVQTPVIHKLASVNQKRQWTMRTVLVVQLIPANMALGFRENDSRSRFPENPVVACRNKLYWVRNTKKGTLATIQAVITINVVRIDSALCVLIVYF